MSVDMIVGFLSNTLNVSLYIYTFKVILLFIVSISQISKGNFDKLLKSILSYHTHLVLILSFILLFLIILKGGINTSIIDTEFLRKNSEGNFGENLYSFPYGLGLFIVGQNFAQIGLIKFPQYCSFYFEPQVFCFFYFPFLFIYFSYLDSSRLKVILLLFSLAIAFFVFSLTNLISLACVFLFLYSKYFVSYRSLCLLLILCLIFVLNIFPQFSSEDLSLLRKLTSSSAEDTLGIYYELFFNFDFLGKPFNTLNISSSYFSIHTQFSIISTLCWTFLYLTLIIMSFAHRKSSPYIAAGLIYALISTLKSPTHALPSVVICVLILALKNSHLRHFEKI